MPKSPLPNKSELLRESPSWMRRIRKWTLLYVVVPYCLLALLMFSFQRYLMYHPTRVKEIRVEDAGMASGKVQTIITTTEDGLRLRGWHVLADGFSVANREESDRPLADAKRVILYFYGNALDRSRRADDCRDFTEFGADVFLFDYRGYGDNPGSPSEQGLAADARAVWNYATQERRVPPERIVLFGESLGGGVATRLCSELCEAGTPPAGLILSSTFSSMSDTAAWHYPFLPVRWLLRDRYESVERISSVTCPVLQIHGARDTIVPIELGQKLFSAIPEMSAGGIEKQFLILTDAGHNNIPKQQFRRAVGEFFLKIDSGN